MSTTLNSIGLILDIVAGLILFRFGLPEKIDTEGHVAILQEQDDEEQIKKGKLFKAWSKFGIVLLTLGFVFQLASNYISN